MKKHFIYFLIFSCFYGQSQKPLLTENFFDQKQWVDSVYSSMNIDQKIGQLFTVWVATKYGDDEIKHISKLINDHHLGGLIFSLGNIKDQAKAINKFQEISKVPLLISMDAEWGIGMRLDDAFSFPYNMTLGAIKNDSLVYNVGKRIGYHAKRLGVHINFAPVVDINTNPRNPIIGSRSFGEDKFNVANKGISYLKGMHEYGIMGAAKHFPGHGDTENDSHKTLPTISFDKNRINNIELYPFKKLIENNLDGIMTAHLNIPNLDKKEISTLSQKVINNLLVNDLGFEGLVITDALDMKAIVDFSKGDYPDITALNAGNDLLLMPTDVGKSIKEIKNAYQKNKISPQRLESAVKKILYAKYKAGLGDLKPIEIDNIVDDLNQDIDYALLDRVAEESITLVKNQKLNLPLDISNNQSVGYVNFGDDSYNTFINYINKYKKVDHINKTSSDSLIEKTKSYDKIIIGLHKTDKSPFEDYKFTKDEISFINEVKNETNLTIVVFSKPYSMLDIDVDGIESIIIAYQNSEIFQIKAAQALFGAIDTKGVLPVSINKKIPVNTSIQLKKKNILSFEHHLNKNFEFSRLKKIDSIINFAIENKMTPGAQLLIAKEGSVIYQKSYGYHTYDNNKKVTNDDIYDLASLTKILVSVPLIIKEFESNNLNLNTKLGELFPDFELSDKKDLKLNEILSHNGRLTPWIPFYKETLDSISKKQLKYHYSNVKTQNFSVEVRNGLFMRDWNDTIIKRIINSPMLEKKEYKYSDLPYYFIKKYLEDKYSSSLDHLVKNYIFSKISANTLSYNPHNNNDFKSIVPSENDTYFRNGILKGFVHDMGAAMQGGVGGHAGLFGNSLDVAKIMQLYLQKGNYGNLEFFSSGVFDDFNKCHFCDDNVRRGIGFDKPEIEDDETITCDCVSKNSFGHSGFTGTYAWADPEDQIIYVFLSNRTYPTMENRKLIDNNIRTDIKKIVFD